MYYYYELAGRKWQEWLPDFQAVELFYPRLLTDPTVRQIGDTAERKKGRQEDGNQPWNIFSGWVTGYPSRYFHVRISTPIKIEVLGVDYLPTS